VGALSRLLKRVAQSDEERHREEVRGWADDVPETTRIQICPGRGRVKVAGVVRRIRLSPSPGEGSFSVVIHDGTGEITAFWTGRDHIPGLRLGTRVVLEGMVSDDRATRRMVNPSYEFA